MRSGSRTACRAGRRGRRSRGEPSAFPLPAEFPVIGALTGKFFFFAAILFLRIPSCFLFDKPQLDPCRIALLKGLLHFLLCRIIESTAEIRKGTIVFFIRIFFKHTYRKISTSWILVGWCKKIISSNFKMCLLNPLCD